MRLSAIVLLAACAAPPEGDPTDLPLADLRRHARNLAKHPERVFTQGGDFRSLGTADVGPLLEATVRGPDIPDAVDHMQHLHRVMVPAQVPLVVSLLENAQPQVFLGLVWLLESLAW